MPHATRYDPVAVTLHWVIGVIIILMLSTAFFLENLPEAWRGTAFGLHKSFGITVLTLSIFRLIWRLLNPPPALPAGMKPFERIAAKVTHWLFYVLMIGMPLSGWLMVSASRKYPTIYFGLGEVPFIPMPTTIDPKAARELFYQTHEYLAIGAITLVILHIGAALKHQFIYKDNLISRMLPEWASRRLRA